MGGREEEGRWAGGRAGGQEGKRAGRRAGRFDGVMLAHASLLCNLERLQRGKGLPHTTLPYPTPLPRSP